MAWLSTPSVKRERTKCRGAKASIVPSDEEKDTFSSHQAGILRVAPVTNWACMEGGTVRHRLAEDDLHTLAETTPAI